MGRFSDIYRGGELKLALDNLNKYRSDATTRQSPRLTGTGTPKQRVQTKLAVIPFESKVLGGGTTHILVRASKAAVESTDNFAKATISKYYTEAGKVAEGKLQNPVKKYSPARAVTFDPVTGAAGKYTKSKFTGLYYVKRDGVTSSLPIGLTTTADTATELQVKSTIRGELQTVIDQEAYRRISFTEEKIPD